MKSSDVRLKVLAEARRILEKSIPDHADPDELLALLDVLTAAIQKFEPDPMMENPQQLAESLIANHALLALTKQQADELDALKKLSLSLTSSLDLQSVLDAVVSEAMSLVAYPRAAHIFLYHDDRLEFGAALDESGNRDHSYSEPRPNGLTYTVARGGETTIVEDMHAHPLYADAPSHWAGSIIGIPLKMGQKVVGVMNLSRTQCGNFSPSEIRLLTLLADQAAIAISNASLHQMVRRQANSDTLTGLPNRRALDERLEKEVQAARRSANSFAVIMMDLDGFKVINDTFGHDTGDKVLREVSVYLARGVRSTDFLARYGGDELTLILSQIDLPAATVVAEKMLEALSKFRFEVADGELRLGMSGGIAIYPAHARTAADLLRAADEALYRAKKHSRGTFVVARGITTPLPPA